MTEVLVVAVVVGSGFFIGKTLTEATFTIKYT